jgi:hypothetical protein
VFIHADVDFTGLSSGSAAAEAPKRRSQPEVVANVIYRDYVASSQEMVEAPELKFRPSIKTLLGGGNG